MNNGERIISLDIIKIIAAFFVVILHVNGYTMEAKGITSASEGTVFFYYVMEGTAFIAVHLFVLAGSYLMCGKEYLNLQSILRTWITTLFITISGLIIAFIIGIHPSIRLVFQSLFPISLRAYGYVSSYILLMLLSPFLNVLIRNLNNKQLYYISALIVSVNIVFPTVIPFIGWGENYTVLFVCLYFVSASIYRLSSSHPNSPNIYGGGVCLWLLSTVTLIASPYLISKLSCRLIFLVDKSDFFYNYHNIIVLIEAVGLFLWINKDFVVSNSRLNRIIQYFSKGSLVVYLYHMHPIFKRMYSELSIFKELYSEVGSLYIIRILGASVCIFVIGILLNSVISKIVKKISDMIILIVKHKTFIKKILQDFKISIVS